MKKENTTIEDFIYSIKIAIDYWEKQGDRNSRSKMEGLTLTILTMLDGVSGNYGGNIDKIAFHSRKTMLHEVFGRIMYELKREK